MSPRVEIITIGDEILNGTVVDTNSAWLGQQAQQLGVAITRRLVVPDTIEAVVEAMEHAAARADVVITSGGLGPTVDDLTAEASAAFLGVPVTLHPEAEAQIEARRKAAGRYMRDIDRKQAMLPAGATVLENPVGTAPGFSVEHRQARLYHLPGVPREWRELCERYVLPDLRRRATEVPETATWKFFGVTESELASTVGELDTSGIELHYRAHFPEIHLTVLSRTPGAIARLEPALMQAVGHRCFGGPDDELPAVVNQALRERGWTLATAESCTGGLIAQLVTSVPGSSEVFHTGLVTYSNASKVQLLGVDTTLLETHGAVSEPVVTAMARGARERYGATLGIACSGIAGPGGGTPEKPVGTVHVALATPDTVKHRRFQFPFDRERTRVVTAWAALELVRRYCNPSRP